MKKCPKCHEEVQDAAIVCKHCDAVLEDHLLGCWWAGVALWFPFIGWISALVYAVKGKTDKAKDLALLGGLGILLEFFAYKFIFYLF